MGPDLWFFNEGAVPTLSVIKCTTLTRRGGLKQSTWEGAHQGLATIVGTVIWKALVALPKCEEVPQSFHKVLLCVVRSLSGCVTMKMRLKQKEKTEEEIAQGKVRNKRESSPFCAEPGGVWSAGRICDGELYTKMRFCFIVDNLFFLIHFCQRSVIVQSANTR
jgi:hypothetical protein